MNFAFRLLAEQCLAVLILQSLCTASGFAQGRVPLIIAHRGASGQLPEHTLAAYQRAMEQGADFIELDLVATRDGVLVCRHEPNIVSSTDVASHPEFQKRKVTKLIDGKAEEGFFIEDFSSAELKKLRAVQAKSFRDQSFNGLYQVPSLSEVIHLVKSFEKKTGRVVGIYLETKHPSYFRALDLALEKRLLSTLEQEGFTDPKRIYIESFEVGNLKDILAPMLKARGLAIPLIQLIDNVELQPIDYTLAAKNISYGDLITPQSLKYFVASYARGIGPSKQILLPRKKVKAMDLNHDGRAESSERLITDTTRIINDAHAAGLLVHAYTFRDEEEFLAQDDRDARAEYERFARLQLDGFFTDFPASAKRAMDLMQKN